MVLVWNRRRKHTVGWVRLPKTNVSDSFDQLHCIWSVSVTECHRRKDVSENSESVE